MPAPTSPPTSAPTLTDGVVTLRAHRVDDVPRMVEQCRDPEMVRWTTVPVPYAEADAATYALEVVPQGWAQGRWEFAVEVDGRFAGSVALRDEAPGCAEVAYGAHPDVRGTGTMERALRLLLAWGYDELGLQTVVWRAFVGNWGSRRLAWRLGFRVEGTVRGLLPQRGALHDGWVGTLLNGDPREPVTTWLDVPTVEADGFRLRPLRADDAPRIQSGTAEPETERWLGHKPAPYTMEHAAAYVEKRTEMAATGDGITWAIADPDDDRLMGTVLLFHRVPGLQVELGYWLHPEGRGRGLATRAGLVALDHAFATYDVQRVTAVIAAGNTASREVAERLGFRLVGVARDAVRLRDGLADLAHYDLTASEWPGLRSSRNASASTANPATDSTAPISSGER